MTKRLTKKYFNRVSEAQKTGHEVPFFYLSKTREIVSEFVDNQYMTVFRPWWYEQDWSKYELADEMKRNYQETIRKAEEKWSIDVRKIGQEYMSRKRVQKPKPRKQKAEPPIRRFRNPEVFSIKLRSGEWVGVEGELAFEIQGYKFFIYRIESYWGVADVITGALIKRGDTYKKAVKQARERIVSNFDKYVELAQRHGQVREDI